MNKAKLMKQTKDYHAELICALSNPKEATAYLQIALEEYEEDGEVEAFLIALKNVAQAQGGIALLAEKTHLNRQNLYRTLSSGGNPRLNTLGVILHALGFRLAIRPV